MAKFISSYKIISDRSDHEASATFTENYWGSKANEKMFPIPFWKVREMLGLCNSNQIALRVKNIENPAIVSAQWMVLEQSQVDSLQDPVEQGIHYFIMDDTIFEGPIVSASGSRQGMLKSATVPHKSIIWGRLGKGSNRGSYHAFFLPAECTIIQSYSNPGGSGPACGAKIPPGGI